jgi:hypothetical protein
MGVDVGCCGAGAGGMGRGRGFDDDDVGAGAGTDADAGVAFVAADTRAALPDCGVSADFFVDVGRDLVCCAACGA